MMGAMLFRHELTYDAPLAAVAAMLADPTFRDEVCTAQRAVRAEVQVEDGDGRTSVVIDQEQAAEGIPSFAKKFVGEEINLVQREDWTSADAADIHVAIPGKPGEMNGTIRLTESNGTTTESFDAEIKVGIPLVGGKIERLIGDLLRKALIAEERVGRDYLSR